MPPHTMVSSRAARWLVRYQITPQARTQPLPALHQSDRAWGRWEHRVQHLQNAHPRAVLVLAEHQPWPASTEPLQPPQTPAQGSCLGHSRGVVSPAAPWGARRVFREAIPPGRKDAGSCKVQDWHHKPFTATPRARARAEHLLLSEQLYFIVSLFARGSQGPRRSGR